MDFAAWKFEVARLIRLNRPEFQEWELEPNIAYQAFAAGVRPDVFAQNPALVTLPLAPLPTQLPQPPQKRRSNPTPFLVAGAFVFILLCGGGFLFLRSLIQQENQFWEQLSKMPEASNFPDRNEPLDDEGKISKAREDLAQWTGDKRVYEEDIALLGDIIEPSPYNKEARTLILKWKAKKGELDKGVAPKTPTKK